jgi:N-acyl-L-homoserine lactone synthetase
MTLAVRVLTARSEDYARIRDWRDSYIGANPANESSFDSLEVLRNDTSYPFAFYREGRLVGGVRFIPVGHGLTLSERLVDLPATFGRDVRLLEVSRLLLDETQRGGTLATDALRCCFDWVRENTLHDGLVALCAPRFVPLYERVGASVVRHDVRAAQVPGKRYCLIHTHFRSNS